MPTLNQLPGAAQAVSGTDLVAVSQVQIGGPTPGAPILVQIPVSSLPAGNTSALLPKAGGTMTGPIILASDPSAALQPATKQYVDTAISGVTVAAGALPKTGGTMTGPIVLAANPTAALQPTTKQYVDAGVTTAQTTANTASTTATAASAVAATAATTATAAQTTANAALPKAGGTVTGALTLNTQTKVGTSAAYNGLPFQFQSGIDFDPSTSGHAENRYNMVLQNLSYATSSSNLFLGLSSFINLSGPGVALGEINCFEGQLSISSGGHYSSGEGYEMSLINSGIVGDYASYYSFIQNTASGTMTGIVSGINFNLLNANTTAGAINVYAALNFAPMLGGGSQPTFYYMIRNTDPLLGIGSLGGIVIGTLGLPATAGNITVYGATITSGTFSLVVKNSALTRLFDVDNAGNVYGANFIGPSMQIVGPNTTAGTFPVSIKNSALARLFDVDDAGHVFGAQISTNSLTITGPDTLAGTFILTVKNSAAARLFDVDDAGNVYGAHFAGTSLVLVGPDTSSGTFALTVKNSAAAVLFGVRDDGFVMLPAIPGSTTYANDAAAATGGVPVGGVYRNGSAIQCRIS